MFWDPLQRRFKLLCATRGLSIRAEVSRLIEQELAKVDDIDAALRAVLGPAPRTLPSPTGHLLISQPLLGLECSTYPPASITRSPHPHPLYRHLLRVDSCMRHRSHFGWILR